MRSAASGFSLQAGSFDRQSGAANIEVGGALSEAKHHMYSATQLWAWLYASAACGTSH